MTSLLERIGGAAARRRRATVMSWLLIAAAMVGLAQVAGGSLIDNVSIPGTETQRALDLLQARFPAFAGGSAQIVFHARDGRITDETNVAAIAAMVDRVRALPDVIAVTSPLAPEGQGQVSPDGTIAYADIRYGVPATEVGPTDMDALEAAMAAGRSPALQVEGGGETFLANVTVGGSGAELIGVAMAVLVLVVAFGSLVAAGLPIVTALFGIVVGLSLVTLLARIVNISLEGPTIAMMLGLGAGIDYALFVVTRHRELLRRGMSVEQAAGRATATSGLAVLFAGSTVVVALLGLSFTGIAAIGSLGLAAAVVVAVTVLAAVTLLPALLGFAGARIDRLALRLPGSASRRTRSVDDEQGASDRWARRVVNRPWTYLLIGAAVMLVLAAPVLSLRLGQPDAGNLSTSDTQRRAYDLISSGFGPGFNGPLAIVLGLPAAGGPADPQNARFVADVSSAIAADPTIVAVGPAIPSAAGDTAVLTAIPRTAPQDSETDRLIRRLRTETLPPIVAGAGAGSGAGAGAGTVALVAGPTAAVIDLARSLEQSLPLFIGAVVLLSGLLLSLVFRSIVVPITAALLNLVSIGAAYGAVVAIFQWGWGIQLVGLEATVPIMSFVPILMFAVLFGLSMDYHVFLVSRIREEYLRTGDSRQSVVTGLARTARVISSAAFVMICVFLAFATSEAPMVKMMAVGSAVAVLVDATLVRMMLVPAAMALLGRANWWLPGPLDRVMPQFSLDGRPEAAEAEVAMDPVVVDTPGGPRAPRRPLPGIVLSVEGIAKRFGEVEAVRGLSFEVRAGEIFGLLGPNGAGKTTTIRLISGLLDPDAGRVLIHGRPLAAHGDGRARVGFCPQELVLFEKLGCLEQLELTGQLYGLTRRAAREAGRRLLAELGLEDKERALAGTLSGGMKRRLNLALALVHEPELLVLDEPEAGLDPQSRVRVRDYIRSLARKKTVLLTTHDMDEADRLADRVAVIDHGQLLVLDTPEALKRRLAGDGELLEIRLAGSESEAAAALAGLTDVQALVSPGLLTVRTRRAAERLPAILERLASRSIAPGEVRLRPASLEDVFLSLTGRSLRE